MNRSFRCRALRLGSKRSNPVCPTSKSCATVGLLRRNLDKPHARPCCRVSAGRQPSVPDTHSVPPCHTAERNHHRSFGLPHPRSAVAGSVARLWPESRDRARPTQRCCRAVCRLSQRHRWWGIGVAARRAPVQMGMGVVVAQPSGCAWGEQLCGHTGSVCQARMNV